MKRAVCTVLLLFLFLILAIHSSIAATDEEVIITATRIGETPKETTKYVTVVTRDDISKMGNTVKDAGDVIARLGLGHVHKYPGFLTGKISIRGYSTDAMGNPYKGGVLILLNGHPIGRTNLALIPVEDIERIEVIKGPNAVLYGSQIMGGVINIVTMNASIDGPHATAKLSLGSFQYRKGYANVSYKNDVISIFGSYMKEKSGDYKVKDMGIYKNTSYDDGSGYLSLAIEPMEGHKFFARILSFHSWDVGSPGATYWPTPYAETENLKVSYETGYDGKLGKLLFYHIIDHYIYQDKNPIWPYKSKYRYNTEGADYQKTFNIFNSTILLGGSYNRIYASQPVERPSQPNSDYMNYAIFAMIEKKLFEKLTINLGGRYDYFRFKTLPTSGLKVNPNDESEDKFTYTVGARYALLDWLSLKANFGKGFRVPTPLEKTGNYTGTYGTWVGNPGLKPEVVYGVDGGIEINKGPLFISLSSFYSNYIDIITTYQPSRRIYSYKNAPGARINGIEAEGHLELAELLNLPFSLRPYFSLTYHTTYHLDKEDRGEKRITYIPDWVGTFGIRLASEKYWIDLSARYNGREKIDEWNYLSPNYYKIVDKGGYTVFYLSTGISPIKNLEVSLSVENLFNIDYEYVKYYPMPKVNSKLSVIYKF